MKLKQKKMADKSSQTIAILSEMQAKRMNTKQKMIQVRQFAQKCRYEQGHSEQVLKLSEILFKKLAEIQKFSSHELFLLMCAAILHDIGWAEGQARHHKTTLRMILDDQTLPLSATERKIVALIGRYHRKALPKPGHTVYRELSAAQQKQVLVLGGILRIADGLDRSHMAVVEDVDVRIFDDTVEFQCKTQGAASPELFAAQKKADLFEKISGRKTRFIRK